MSLQAIDKPQTAATQAPTKRRIGAKVKRAIDVMAWQGLTWQEAAKHAHLSTYNMRLALKQQHVIEYLKQERQVLRNSLSSRAEHRMVEISEQNDNYAAAYSATRDLRGLVDQEIGNGMHRSMPGLTIVIETHASHALPNARIVDALPNDINGLDDKSP